MHPALLKYRVPREQSHLFVAIVQGLVACRTPFFLAVPGDSPLPIYKNFKTNLLVAASHCMLISNLIKTCFHSFSPRIFSMSHTLCSVIPGGLVRLSGRTSRTTPSLTCQATTPAPTMRTCSGQCSAFVPWGGPHGAPVLWRASSLAAYLSSSVTTSCSPSRTLSGEAPDYIWVMLLVEALAV